MSSCRSAGDTQAARVHLNTVFGAAAFCVAAKLLEAALLMEESDYGGAAAISGQVRCRRV